MILKCIIACHNASGKPDLAFVKVQCNQAQYDEGQHYEAAQDWARQDNYEPPFVVFDENDVSSGLLELFIWNSAAAVDVAGAVPAKPSPLNPQPHRLLVPLVSGRAGWRLRKGRADSRTWREAGELFGGGRRGPIPAASSRAWASF